MLFFGSIFCAFVFFQSAHAQTIKPLPWEVAVIFLDSNFDDDYQRDIDKNILELSQSIVGPNFKLSILREFEDRIIKYYVAPPDSRETHPWEDLFFEPPHCEINKTPYQVFVPGTLTVDKKNKNTQKLIQNNQFLISFFKTAFSETSSKRLLMIYAHGLAYKGLYGIKLKPLRKQLEAVLPPREGQKPLEILWFDACFMSSIEVGFELRNLAQLLIASEEKEFSSGTPFESLKILQASTNSAEENANELAKKFINSYSFYKGGKQTKNVVTTPATLSVVDLSKIEDLVQNISEFVKNLKMSKTFQTKNEILEIKNRLSKTLKNRQTALDDFVDFGRLLLYFKEILNPNLFQEASKKLAVILDKMSFSTFKILKTNPRVPVHPPHRPSHMVYGYDLWTRGNQSDSETLDKIPAELKPVVGENKNEPSGYSPLGENIKTSLPHVIGSEKARNDLWPFIKVKETFAVSPFFPGSKTFHFFFMYFDTKINQIVFSAEESFERLFDTNETRAINEINPIRYFAYTQGSGTQAEHYTGLGVLDPSLGAFSLDYLDLDFELATDWSKIFIQ